MLVELCKDLFIHKIDSLIGITMPNYTIRSRFTLHGTRFSELSKRERASISYEVQFINSVPSLCINPIF